MFSFSAIGDLIWRASFSISRHHANHRVLHLAEKVASQNRQSDRTAQLNLRIWPGEKQQIALRALRENVSINQIFFADAHALARWRLDMTIGLHWRHGSDVHSFHCSAITCTAAGSARP